MLKFDEKTHEYFLDDTNLPSVTKIIESAGLIDSYWFTEEAQTRGKYIHEACAMLVEGKLNWGSVDPLIVNYVKAFEAFLHDIKGSLKIKECEKWKYSKEFMYAGTPDLIVEFAGGGEGVIDIKTGTSMPWHEIQLAAYAAFISNPSDLRLYTLHLKKDGKYSLKSNKGDWRKSFQIFLNCLSIYNWKVKYLKKGK